MAIEIRRNEELIGVANTVDLAYETVGRILGIPEAEVRDPYSPHRWGHGLRWSTIARDSLRSPLGDLITLDGDGDDA